MKISLKKYLLYSSVFAIFTEAFMVRSFIDLKLLYLILIVNFSILINLKQIRLNLYFIYLLLFFLFHGFVMYLLIGIPPNYLLSQIIGIGFIGTYFYSIIKLYGFSSFSEIYLKISLWIATIGYPIYFINRFFSISLMNDLRFHSILSEPAHYAVVIIPACYYFLKSKEYKKFGIIFGTLILSESSLALIGCGLMFLLPILNLKRISLLITSIPVFIGVFYIIYLNNEMVKIRFDDTYDSLNSIYNGKFDNKTNLSTYALISNLYVAKSNFIDHPFGSGLGSHFYMYTQEYFTTMRSPEYIKTLKLDKLNSHDAASLFIRLLSELGIFGLILIFYLMRLSSKVFSKSENFLVQGIFIYFLLKLFRDGHYFPPEFYPFIWLFYFSIKENRNIALNENENTNLTKSQTFI